MKFWREVLIATVIVALVVGAFVVPVKHQSALDILDQLGAEILWHATRRH